jgi:hypothetical protein
MLASSRFIPAAARCVSSGADKLSKMSARTGSFFVELYQSMAETLRKGGDGLLVGVALVRAVIRRRLAAAQSNAALAPVEVRDHRRGEVHGDQDGVARFGVLPGEDALQTLATASSTRWPEAWNWSFSWKRGKRRPNQPPPVRTGKLS